MFMRAVHPGGRPEGQAGYISPTEFSRQIDVLANRVSQIIAGKWDVTGDTALRLRRGAEEPAHHRLAPVHGRSKDRISVAAAKRTENLRIGGNGELSLLAF